MTYDSLNDLLVSYEETEADLLFEFDIVFFDLFYYQFNDFEVKDIPMYALGFLEIDTWQGMAQRCGVWQFYESRSYEPQKFSAVINLLKSQGEDEFVKVFASGIHDYANPKYAEKFNYPDEWLEQSDTINNWIYDNEEKIYQWKRKLILSHRDEILELSDNKI